VIPLGRLHSDRLCYRCGATDDLHEVVVAATWARAMVCADMLACCRRVQATRRAAA
jgi:hypothetical protein